MGRQVREATFRLLHAEVDNIQRSLAEDSRGLDTKAALVSGLAAAAVSFLLDAPRGVLWWAALAAHAAAFGLALATLWPHGAERLQPRRMVEELRVATVGEALDVATTAKVRNSEEQTRRVQAATTTWTYAASALVVGMVLTVATTVTG